jgi:alpha-1,2-mannosyltransferase
MTLGVLALVVVVGAFAFSATEGLLGWDVRFAYLPAAELVLDGESPYPALDDPILEDQKGYVYPPQLALVLTPLTVLPVGVAAFLAACLMVALVGLTLWIVGVRDPLCFAAAALWVPSISGVLLSNLSIPLACALAIVWRYRDTARPAGATLGLAVSAKLVLWPMFVWMLATRRVRATVLALAVGIAVTIASWAVIGFAGFGGYPDLVRRLSEIQAENSYSIVGMVSTLGFDPWLGRALTIAVGGALLVGCVAYARSGDDARAFTCAVTATLAISPIVWLHYLVVLLVPMAILRPRFSLVWLLPVLLWVSPKPGYAEGYATFVPAIATAIVVAVLLAPRSSPGEAAPAGS